MKTNLSAAPTTVEGLLETQSATISDISKIFDLLATSLYSDRPLAIVREYSCNCTDGHKRAGTTARPFEVTAPTSLHPYVTFKDYGTGMTHEEVMRRYLDLCWSSKEGSNDEIGQKGLGCKSAFSYAEAFTVESRQNNLKRIYSVFKEGVPTGRFTDDGEPILKAVPQIALVGTAPTDEPNGMTVTVPVLAADFGKFSKAIQQFCWRFNPQPITNVTLYEPEYLIEAPTWKIRADSYRLASVDRAAQAIMGGVPYPIQANPLDLPYGDELRKLLELPLDIDFPIGSVEPAPNRESLTYDKRTIASIKKRLAEIRDELVPQYEALVSKAASWWEACCTLGDADDDLPDEVKDILWRHLSWQGRKLEPNLHIKLDQGYACVLSDKKTQLIRPKIDWRSRGDVAFTKNVKVFYWDGVAPLHRRLKYSDDFWGTVLLLTGTDRAALLEHCGNPPCIDVADLEDPPKSYYGRSSSGPKIKIKEYVANTGWCEASVQPANGGVYVDLFKDDIISTVPSLYFSEAWHLAERLGAITPSTPVYGITASFKSIPKKHPGWVNLFDLAAKAIKDRANDPEFIRAIQAKDALGDIPHGLRSFLNKGPAIKHQRILDKYRELQADTRSADFVRTVRKAAVQLGVKLKEPRPVTVKLFDNFIKKFPLLNVFNTNDACDLQVWINYVNGVRS